MSQGKTYKCSVLWKKEGDKVKNVTIDLVGKVVTHAKENLTAMGDLEVTIGNAVLKDELPPDTVIFTHSNPTCKYYWNGYRWIRD